MNYALHIKISVSGIAEKDKRGQHKPAIKISDENLTWKRDHIYSFLKDASDYGESRLTRQYLRPDLSMNQMY